MKITYQQAKEAAINLACTLGEMTDTSGHVSGEHWSMDDYVIEITAGDKFDFTVHGEGVGEGFPELPFNKSEPKQSFDGTKKNPMPLGSK